MAKTILHTLVKLFCSSAGRIQQETVPIKPVTIRVGLSRHRESFWAVSIAVTDAVQRLVEQNVRGAQCAEIDQVCRIYFENHLVVKTFDRVGTFASGHIGVF